MQTYCKSFRSAVHCKNSMCYIRLVSVHFHSHVHAVSCLVLSPITHRLSLTPSICGMVRSLMDVMTYVTVRFSRYLLCGHLYSSVKCVVCIHTAHRPLAGLLYTHLLIHVTTYMRAIYNYTTSCVNCY